MRFPHDSVPPTGVLNHRPPARRAAGKLGQPTTGRVCPWLRQIRARISAMTTLTATMQTSEGTIVLRLFPDQAPKTVSNFVELAEGTREWTNPQTSQTTRGKLYDGTIFHRVIPDFMIQGGDPLGTGTGGPGYKFGDEFHPELSFSRPYLLDGECRARHQRLPVLHHHGPHPLAEPQAHHLRGGRRGRRRRGPDQPRQNPRGRPAGDRRRAGVRHGHP